MYLQPICDLIVVSMCAGRDSVILRYRSHCNRCTYRYLDVVRGKSRRCSEFVRDAMDTRSDFDFAHQDELSPLCS